jgi:hypothetical protein
MSEQPPGGYPGQYPQQPPPGQPHQPWPQQTWPQQPVGQPPPPMPPQRKRHRVRNGIIIGAAVIVALIIVGAALGSTGNGHKAAAAGSSQPSTPAATPTPGPKVFYNDVKAEFPVVAPAGEHSVVSLGQTLCNRREAGISQLPLIKIIQRIRTGINAQSFVRLAEKDLCPTYLAPVAAIKPLKPKVIAKFSGNGQSTTAPFNVPYPGNWYLVYSYDCSNFGGSGNFAVDEGSSDYNGVNVNELSPGAHNKKSYVYNDAGRHHLEILSECSWTVKVVIK